jgi:hypothetical protein
LGDHAASEGHALGLLKVGWPPWNLLVIAGGDRLGDAGWRDGRLPTFPLRFGRHRDLAHGHEVTLLDLRREAGQAADRRAE